MDHFDPYMLIVEDFCGLDILPATSEENPPSMRDFWITSMRVGCTAEDPGEKCWTEVAVVVWDVKEVLLGNPLEDPVSESTTFAWATWVLLE